MLIWKKKKKKLIKILEIKKYVLGNEELKPI